MTTDSARAAAAADAPGAALAHVAPPKPSASLFRKRLRKFRSLKRGYYCFLLLTGAYLLSWLLPFFVSNKALVVRYQGKYYYPILQFYSAKTFGMPGIGEAKYRKLAEKFREAGGEDWVLLPLHPYGPNENLLNELEGNPPHPPSRAHPMGTDDRARDVFARLAYGFNISITFALILTVVSYGIGIAIGAALGYFGGRVDIVGVRLVEIWSTVPFLYLVMILSAILLPKYYQGRSDFVQPGFWLLIGIMGAFGWMSMTFYVRGEYLREKARDYVSAAVATGASTPAIIARHILPNALTPVISLAPFTIVGEIASLVALDFLGFGLPAPTPSWGELLGQGLDQIANKNWWLITFAFLALFGTLLVVVFIGEAIREAFDPKPFSRLR
ncbi:MAG: ABC transporter permease subunit [Planctomycetes bacterium]|nr:ABC transporter permease subunit [Planctomycetota bacterium]